MPTRVAHPPAPPVSGPLYRRVTAGAVLGGCGFGMWTSAGLLAEGAHLHTQIAGPTSMDWGYLGTATFLAYAGVAGAQVVRNHRYERALVEQGIYEQVARVLGLDLSDRARMRVRDRRGQVPTSITLRVDKPHQPRTEAIREAVANARLLAAFAHATGQPPARVRIARTRNGVRLWVEQPQDARAQDLVRDTPAVDEEARYSAPEPPAPVVPADLAIAEDITEALRGLIDKTIECAVTETHPDGAAAEVWITYPAKLTSTIGAMLQDVRQTMQSIQHARNDEWSVQWVSQKKRIILTDMRDPLAPVVPMPDLDLNPDLTKGVVIGVTAGGAPWHLPLMGGNHTLIAGASGAGKGSVEWGILRALEPLIKDGRVRLWLYDPKGGAELGPARPYAYRYATKHDQAAAMLEELLKVLDRKAEQLAATSRAKIEVITPEEPLDLLIVDELMVATSTDVGGQDAKLIGGRIAAICALGRAPAVTVIGAVQDPRKETFKHRDLFTAAIALRLRGAGETNLILGPGARAEGAAADMIPKAHPGIGYVQRDGKADYDRVRAAFTADSEKEALARRIKPDLPAPTIGDPLPFAEQEPIPEDDDPKVITTVASPKASTRAPAKPRAVAAAKVTEDPWVRLVAINDLPRKVRFDGDDRDGTVNSIEESPDDPERLVVSFTYDGHPAARDIDVEADEKVQLRPKE